MVEILKFGQKLWSYAITPLSTRNHHSKSVEFEQNLWCLSQILTDFDKSVRIWLKFHRFWVLISGGEWCYNAKILEWNSLTHSVTESAWELQDKNSGRCSESFCILPSTSLTTSLWTGCLVLISLCALLLCVQDLQVFQLRHDRWHHSRRMANWIQCFPQGSSSSSSS